MKIKKGYTFTKAGLNKIIKDSEKEMLKHGYRLERDSIEMKDEKTGETYFKSLFRYIQDKKVSIINPKVKKSLPEKRIEPRKRIVIFQKPVFKIKYLPGAMDPLHKVA